MRFLRSPRRILPAEDRDMRPVPLSIPFLFLSYLDGIARYDLLPSGVERQGYLIDIMMRVANQTRRSGDKSM